MAIIRSGDINQRENKLVAKIWQLIAVVVVVAGEIAAGERVDVKASDRTYTTRFSGATYAIETSMQQC